MATPQKSKKSSKPVALPQSEFVRYELSKEEKAACKALPFGPEEFEGGLERLVDSDYKISFSYDTYNKCFAAFLVPVGAEHPNAGLILAGRGSSPTKAFKQACYIHYNLLETNWGVARGAREWDMDD